MPWNREYVERNIYRLPTGGYQIVVDMHGTRVKERRPTLSEARTCRDFYHNQRGGRKRDWNVTGMSFANKTGYLPDDVISHRNEIRGMIEKAKRSKVIREGREYTLLRLPDGPMGAT